MRYLILCLLSAFFVSVYGQEVRTLIYKRPSGGNLIVEVHAALGGGGAAIAWFYGGGWRNGGVGQFRPYARYLAARGISSFLFQYRTEESHGTDPFASLADAKSAMRWLRTRATDFGVHPDSILAGGGSAGGHLAAALATVDGYDDPADATSVPTRPAALLLFNPVLDTGPGGYGFDRIGAEYLSFSPLYGTDGTTPPSLILVGDEDPILPLPVAEVYCGTLEKFGVRCDLVTYRGRGHGFFNPGRGGGYDHIHTLLEVDRFLTDLGYLPSRPPGLVFPGN